MLLFYVFVELMARGFVYIIKMYKKSVFSDSKITRIFFLGQYLPQSPPLECVHYLNNITHFPPYDGYCYVLGQTDNCTQDGGSTEELY